MASLPYEIQFNENIYDEAIDKLNILSEDGIKFNNFISEKFESLENKMNFKKSNKIEENKISKDDKNGDKKRKKAIYELLKFYKKANCDKSLKFKLSPFKPLIEPKKIQMDGRIILNNQEN